MSEVRITAENRTEFGKGAARRTRRAHRVPAVVYGHGGAPRHISLPGHELMLALKTPNVLLDVDLEGESLLVLPKDVQRDPIRPVIEHVDLVVVNRGEKVTIEVAVHTTGSVAADALLVVDAQTVTVEAEATHIPTSVDVDVEGLPVGTQIHAKDLGLPEGTTFAGDPETLVINVVAQQSAAQLDADLASSEADLGIVHEEKSADAEADAADAAAPSEG
ncbi:large subunit ribosomal protein L25 [Motilibacter peucedani]|uniref:Large ribosomal subunit protein bL25 n=1 Tax=Motilibacter peucedani TaxID=598650 RepID=A0A420XKR9_9ACTN|nr:50S ribosomal protein L25/general stress protein Ctc [Motilibacter peucedani]RKS68610.1 large subunit ribosomal protein L25 [Motilibacter peucedani]